MHWKEKKGNRKMGKKIKKARAKKQIWKIINRERKWRKKVNKDIEMNKWDEHFRRLLSGVGERVVKGEGRV